MRRPRTAFAILFVIALAFTALVMVSLSVDRPVLTYVSDGVIVFMLVTFVIGTIIAVLIIVTRYSCRHRK